MTESEGGAPYSRLEALGHSSVLAGYARLFTIVASISAAVFLPTGGWLATRAYDAFLAQEKKLEDVRIELSSINASIHAADTSIVQLRDGATRLESRALDQERRLSRVEAVIPPIPNPGRP